MNIGIARPGYFSDKKFLPSMQTNWINYDLLCNSLREYGVKFTTIGFQKTSAADRLLDIVELGSTEFNSKKFRTKTQQAVSSSIMLERNDKLMSKLDALLMPYYTFFQERCYYYTLAYLAAEAGIPLLLWDTDANFIGQVAAVGNHFTIEEARNKVFKDPIYVNSDLIDISLIDSLNLTVLSPALSRDVAYRTYFPFFRIFPHRCKYIPEVKKFDVVYAGSQYNREDLFLKYYDSSKYSVGVCGKYNQKFMDEWKHSKDYYQGHIQRIGDKGNGVQDFLYRGRMCVQIARKHYNIIGHVTPRVYEVVDSGTLLLVDANLHKGWKIVGEDYVVKDDIDVAEWTLVDDKLLKKLHEEQINHPFIANAKPERNAKIIMELL